ncbi:MAG: PAS domain S-box protein [Bacteroidales bacterium]
MFVVELIYNLSVLVALSIVSGFIYSRWSSGKLVGSILQGALFGIVAMLGMLNPLVFDVGLVFDGRSVVISLCGLFFGPVAAAISASMALIFRIFQGGIGALMGVSVIVSSAAIGIIYHYRRKRRNRRISTLFLLGFGLLVHFVMLALSFLLPLESALAVIKSIGIEIIVFYPLATLLIGKILHDQEVKTHSVEALRKSETLFRDIAQSSPTGICKVKGTGEVEFANSRWCDIVGVDCNTVTGSKFINVVYEKDVSLVQSLWNKHVSTGKNFITEFRVQKHGRPFWVLSQFEVIIDEYGNFKAHVGTIIDIDERKRAEEQLRRWETIFLSTQTGITIGDATSRRLELMNPAFAQMHGYTVSELKGKPIDTIIAPTHIGNVDKEIEKAITDGYYVFETMHVKKDGATFPVLVSMTSITDHDTRRQYQISNVQDISELAHIENQLRAERIRLSNIIEGTNVGPWEWNVKTGSIIVSERWAEIVGYSLEEIKPETIDDWKKMVHPDDLEKATVLLEKHFRNETDFYVSEFRMMHKDGHWVWINDRGKVTEWAEDGSPLMMYGIHIDISERKQWEHALEHNQQKLKEQNEEYLALNEELEEINSKLRESQRELKEQNEEYLALNEELNESNLRIKQINSDLKEARNKAQESDELKSAFLANMSHEIRTPMNAIIGFSDILLKPNLAKEKQKLYAEVLNVSCNQLLGIINDVLDISKIETGQVTYNESQTQVNQLLKTTKSIFEHNAKNKNNRIILLPEFNNQLVVFTDEAKLQQILNNLVSNAIKFTHNGTIKVGYQVKDNMMNFFVEDTGSGIAPKNHHAIFERFRQAELVPDKYHSGTGLGLSICKAFVKILGGTIGVESELGKGARFFFSIPYKPIAAPNLRSREDKITNYDFSNATILVVEDEQANFIFINDLLEETKAKIIHARNGVEAVEQVGLNPNITLILMDIKMPIMDGIEATGIIRSMNIDIPIIALTAYAMAGDKKKCIDAGCNAYVSKPVVNNYLLSTLAEFILN